MEDEMYRFKKYSLNDVNITRQRYSYVKAAEKIRRTNKIIIWLVVIFVFAVMFSIGLFILLKIK